MHVLAPLALELVPMNWASKKLTEVPIYSLHCTTLRIDYSSACIFEFGNVPGGVINCKSAW